MRTVLLAFRKVKPLLGDQLGVALHFLSEVGRRILDVYIQEDRILRSDLRSHGQAQERIDVGHRWRTTQLRLSHDRHAHTLFYQGLNIILSDHARPRQNLQQAPRLGHR